METKKTGEENKTFEKRCYNSVLNIRFFLINLIWAQIEKLNDKTGPFCRSYLGIAVIVIKSDCND